MKLFTKRIKSRYLDREFDVLCWEKQEDNRTLTIVSHESLEEIILDTLSCVQQGFYYDVNPITNVAPYPVMKCIMTDATGRQVIAIGEAHPESLINQISKQNPVIMAANRAMDRAVIRYLGFEGKCLSTEEISSSETSSSCADYANMGDVDDYSDESPFGIADEPEKPVPTVSQKNTQKKDGPVVDKSTLPEAPHSKESKNEIGSVIIKFGKYRNSTPKTVAQIWEEDTSWVESMLSIMTPDKCGAETKKQLTALKAYKELMNA